MKPLAEVADMDFAALAADCAPWVAPQTLAAIVRTESQFKPFAININGGAKLERQPATKEEAVVTAKWLLNNNYNIDLGLGQVNSVNLTKTNLSVEDAFDSCKNLAASATILKWNFESASKHIPDEQAALQAAISAYNTGSFTKGFGNGYVQKVMNNAEISSPTLVSRKSSIEPIPLVNIGKRTSVTMIGQQNIPVVKVKKELAEDGEQSFIHNVYAGDKKQKSIMVF